MDSGSGGDPLGEIQVCKNDNVENANGSVEESVPRILSAELHDVFPIFVNMLDVKSFMKLALTSKDMYMRCMENRAIKINIDVDELEAEDKNGSVGIRWPYSFDNAYVATLRGLPCKVNVRVVRLNNIVEASEVMACMKEIRVYRIHELCIDDLFDDDVEAIIAIITNFGVKSVNIYTSIPTDILCSCLHLNLEKLWYDGAVPLDLILEMDSTIREICFEDVDRISKEQIMHISWKIQSGSLSKLTFDVDVIDWGEFDMLPIDHEGPLPDYRLLILTKEPYSDENDKCECWILYSHGGVTKCAGNGLDLELCKCEEWEYPWILRKEEDIIKDLAEKRPKVSCTFDHFRSFSASFTMIERSHKGPLPDVRPLYFKVSDHRFWLLNEEDKLMECRWFDKYAVWTSFDSQYPKEINHPALAKYTFWKLVKQVVAGQQLYIGCEGLNEFESWFDEFDKLNFEYSGSLPKTRPLVFKRAPYDFDGIFMHWFPCQDKHLYVVVLEDRLVECTCKSHRRAEIKRCTVSHRPFIFFTTENVPEMLKVWEREKKLSPVRFRDMISERTVKEFWFMVDRDVWKVWWRGRLSLTSVDLDEAPPNFMKQVFRYLAENEPPRERDNHIFLKLHQFHSCLEQFTVISFDYSGPLTRDSPLAFMKKKINHQWKCSKNRTACGCTEYTILVWFLWNGVRITYCSCGTGEPTNIVEFGKSDDFNDVPPALKSKEYLKNLLLGNYDESSSYDWFGRFDDFLAFLAGYVKLPFDYDGRLPEERPLIFSSRSDENVPAFFILREDGTVAECKKKSASHISISMSSNREQYPHALKNLF